MRKINIKSFHVYKKFYKWYNALAFKVNCYIAKLIKIAIMDVTQSAAPQKKSKLTLWILVAMVLGIIVGYIVHEQCTR